MAVKPTTALRECLDLLPAGDRRKFVIVSIAQVVLSLLDLLGVLLLGLVGALSVQGVSSRPASGAVSRVLEFMGLADNTIQVQVAVLAAIAATALVVRNIASMVVLRRSLFFLSRRAALLSAELVTRLLRQDLLFIQRRSSQSSVYAVTDGVTAIVTRVLSIIVGLASDASVLVVLAIGLAVVDPVTALGAMAFFGFVAWILNRVLSVKATKIGSELGMRSVESRELITESISAFREIAVRDRQEYYSRSIGKVREQISGLQAENAFMPQVSKYVLEISVVVGTTMLAAVQFLLYESPQATASLALFLAAGTRIAPALLRLQQGFLTIRTGLAEAEFTLSLIKELPKETASIDIEPAKRSHEGFAPELTVSAGTLRYPGSETSAFIDVDCHIPKGSFVAIVGPSGAGKTSLVDVMLGLIQPTSGTFTLSNQDPRSAMKQWPGAIAYVPQDSMIADNTIRENVALGYPANEIHDDWVWAALEVAQLADFVTSLPEGIHTAVGERGAKLSGGQRQRLGIARAMYTDPMLLVLDEATSALDSETEQKVAQSIDGLRGSRTLIVIAHRLATVRKADQVLYMDKGRLVAAGTFEQVRAAVPDFDRQANLLGLS